MGLLGGTGIKDLRLSGSPVCGSMVGSWLFISPLGGACICCLGFLSILVRLITATNKTSKDKKDIFLGFLRIYEYDTNN
jgi:hypothetical protein